jgi:hypothetical protein
MHRDVAGLSRRWSCRDQPELYYPSAPSDPRGGNASLGNGFPQRRQNWPSVIRVTTSEQRQKLQSGKLRCSDTTVRKSVQHSTCSIHLHPRSWMDDELELLPLPPPPPPEIPQGLSPFAGPVHEHHRVPELESGKSPHPSIEYDEPGHRTSAAAPMC